MLFIQGLSIVVASLLQITQALPPNFNTADKPWASDKNLLPREIPTSSTTSTTTTTQVTSTVVVTASSSTTTASSINTITISGTTVLEPPGPIIPTSIRTVTGGITTVTVPGTTVLTPPGPIVPTSISTVTSGITTITIPRSTVITPPGPIVPTSISTVTSSISTVTSGITTDTIPIPIPVPGTTVPTPPGPVVPTSTTTSTTTGSGSTWTPSWSNGGPTTAIPTNPGPITTIPSYLGSLMPPSTTTARGYEPALPDLLRKPELPADQVCGKWYTDDYAYWIVQFPPSWWEVRYQNITRNACYLIQASLTAIFSDLLECFTMEHQYASGGPRYLHTRFVTSLLGSDKYLITGMIANVRDHEHYQENHLPMTCQEHSIGGPAEQTSFPAN